MRIEDLAVSVRPRSKWESVDLGARMIQRWFWEIHLPLLLVLIPFWVLANVVLPLEWFSLTIFLLWWLKPVWSRIPLFVISRAMFGTAPTPRETIRAFPSMLRSGLIGSLTLYRFSPNRALNLPVTMLENLSGSARSKRQSILNSRVLGFNILLCSVFILVEWMVFFVGMPHFLANLYPEDLLSPIASLETSAYQHWITTGIYLFSMTIVEPFFIAAGFALYLNTRTVLECWDVELAFRKMAVRLAGAPLLFLMAAGCWMGSTSLNAAVQDVTPQQALEEVMAHEDFQRETKHKKWVLRYEPEQSQNSQTQNRSFSGIADVVAGLVRVIFWIIVAGIAIALLYFLIKGLSKIEAGSKSSDTPDTPTPEIKIKERLALDALPDDIVGGAMEFWGKNNQRQALSILFRGALKALTDRGTLEIADFATEEECLRLVRRKTSGDFALFFKDLTRSWQSLAYAHRPCEEAVFTDLCTRWKSHLGGTP